MLVVSWLPDDQGDDKSDERLSNDPAGTVVFLDLSAFIAVGVQDNHQRKEKLIAKWERPKEEGKQKDALL